MNHIKLAVLFMLVLGFIAFYRARHVSPHNVVSASIPNDVVNESTSIKEDESAQVAALAPVQKFVNSRPTQSTAGGNDRLTDSTKQTEFNNSSTQPQVSDPVPLVNEAYENPELNADRFDIERRDNEEKSLHELQHSMIVQDQGSEAHQ